MKKIFLSVAFICVAQFGMAQNTYNQDVMEMIKLSGSTATISVVIDQVMPMVPEDKKADFKKEFEGTLDSLYEKLIPVYQKYYTHEDIKKMLEFYKSPTGQKISKNAGDIATDSMQVSQEWAMGLQGLMMKYIQE